MLSSVEAFFSGDYMPHGHCYLWQPGILWSNVISDVVITLSYFSIPVALLIVAAQRKEVARYRKLFLLFSSFIFWCGVTHAISVYTIWNGTYGIQGLAKIITATVSAITAIFLFYNLKTLASLPTLEQYKNAMTRADEEQGKRRTLEEQIEKEAMFKFIIELLPAGLIVVDAQRRIRLANQKLMDMFGYGASELDDQPLSVLLPENMSKHHDALVDSYMQAPQQNYEMAAGRVVRGRRKDGEDIEVDISLSVQQYDEREYAFATVHDVKGRMEGKSVALEFNNRVKRAINATNDGIWEWNVTNNKVWYNQRLLSMLGQPVDASPELDMWYQHIHADDLAMVEQQLKEHFDRGTKFDVVYRGDSGEGDLHWFQSRGDTLFDEDGKPLLMSGTLTDVTDLKRLEFELEKKSRFLNEVLDRSLTGLYLFDLEKSCNIFINQQYTEITGYSLEDIHELERSGNFMDCFHPDDVDKVIAHIEELKEFGDLQGHALEYRFRHKEGGWLWCYSKDAVYSRDDRGRPKEMLGSFIDISPLKIREQEVYKLARDFATTFEQAAVGIAHVGEDGSFIKVNKKLCDIVGYERSELLSKTFRDITHKDDLESSDQGAIDLRSGKRSSFIVEKRYLTKHGDVIWANLTTSCATDQSGEFSHYVSVIEDISKRKSAELALADSNAALERFAYSASHDLQEPLRKICSFSNMLQERLAETLDDKDAKFQLDRIIDASTRMSNMINSLLQLSRYTKQQIERENTTLKTLLDLAKDDLSSLISETGIDIVLKDDVPLYVEVNGFMQVLRNILSNSAHYKKPSEASVVVITAENTLSKIRIVMEDNGLGFDSELADQLFEPFRRLVGRNIPGTGMGLAICRQIIQAHKGTIRAEGEPGKGAKFIIELPSIEI